MARKKQVQPDPEVINWSSELFTDSGSITIRKGPNQRFTDWPVFYLYQDGNYFGAVSSYHLTKWIETLKAMTI